MLWFNFILGLNFIFFCLKLILIHYQTQKQKKIKFKPRIKLNHNIYMRNKFSNKFIKGGTKMMHNNKYLISVAMPGGGGGEGGGSLVLA